jgi:hypothetical protein
LALLERLSSLTASDPNPAVTSVLRGINARLPLVRATVHTKLWHTHALALAQLLRVEA